MSTIGLSMIVKNEAHNLVPCLQSVQGLVSQIVIADTGSTDGSVEVAREHGAFVFSIPWESDFAKARNASLERLTTDWVLVLDADEELDYEAKKIIPDLLRAPLAAAYRATFRNYVHAQHARNFDTVSRENDHRHPRAAGAPAFAEHAYCRLFQRRPDLYFTGRVHEAVETRVHALGLKVANGNFLIHHFGQLAEEERKQRKSEFYRSLGRLKVQDEPRNADAWIELGVLEYEQFQNYEFALECLQRALTLNPDARRVYTFVGMIQLELGHNEEALRAFESADGIRQGEALREHFRGDALHNLGRLREARIAYCNSLKLDRLNPIVESKLGYTELRLGMRKAGLSKMQNSVKRLPGLPELHERLVKGYVVAGQLPEAACAAERLIERCTTPKAFLRAASIRAELAEWPQVRSLLERGLQLFPDSQELHRAYNGVKAPAV